MSNIVIGTAGHIDHGKSTLIKTLTGIETDKTKEEKLRGMSINLGFAYFDLPNGERVGVVDVPGHEKFIKNMLAGSAGLNLVLLVIDANEGIMPQTREHMDILTLLGVKDFIIVLTKIDTVDEELMMLVKEDIEQQLEGTVLEDAPVVEVDSISGTGIPTLLDTIEKKCETIEPTKATGQPRLNIDRSFSLKGFGTIVTGTLLEGELHVGDDVIIYPQEIKTRVRSLQVHEQDEEMSGPGKRTAINLTNVTLEDVGRGDVLTTKDNVTVSWMLNVKINLLPSATEGLKLWDRVRLGIGTTETFARVVPLGVEQLEAGEEGFVQLRLEEQVVARDGDRFIIRSYSPVHTIGGGVILDSQPKKNKRYDDSVLASLAIKEEGSIQDILVELLDQQGKGLSPKGFIATNIGKSEAEVADILVDLIAEGTIKEINGKFISINQYNRIANDLVAVLDKYHKNFRLRQGMPKEELKSRSELEMKGKEFDTLLGYYLADNLLKETNGSLSLKDFEVVYNKYNQAHRDKIESTLLKAKFTPPSDEDLTKGDEQIQEVINSLVGISVIRLDHTTVIHKNYYDEAVNSARDFITKNGSMTLADFRDMTGSSRKYSMLILEYMDKMHVTKRVENTRELY
ncbi:selenocysteine-specific translation elongation factor [Vagococcus sp. PNs007]|uniref:Selenocysteine-specific elongation factor n=1 Tax=Vagococcus proximus TaxID=2991417 RepID=A0ABT5X214_9ENTE|nr:selenocysteine-specific translation elongation factor [Vagococcus proximus]MDF0480044.1 selenocysteine-specific translation elongation factor [Vagococcus proximus]